MVDRFGRTAVLAGVGLLALLLVLAAAVALRSGRPAPGAAATTGLAVAVPVDAPDLAPVSVTALEPVWVKVYEPEGEVLFMGELGPGQTYQLPADEDGAMLWTGRPHAVEVRLGETLLPVLGPPDHPLRDISLARSALQARIPPPPPLPPVKVS